MKKNKISSLILKLLNVINYLGDRQKYTEELFQTILLQTLTKLIKNLNKKEKEEILAVAATSDLELTAKVLESKFPLNQLVSELNTSSQQAINGLIKEVRSSLNQNQLSQLSHIEQQLASL
jgi:hypothetical protein